MEARLALSEVDDNYCRVPGALINASRALSVIVFVLNEFFEWTSTSRVVINLIRRGQPWLRLAADRWPIIIAVSSHLN